MDDLERLEHELAAWRPRPPSPALRQAIAQRLRPTMPRASRVSEGHRPWLSPWTSWKWAGGIAAAAVLGFGVFLWAMRPEPGKREALSVARAAGSNALEPSAQVVLHGSEAIAEPNGSTLNGNAVGAFHPVSMARIVTGVEQEGWISLPEGLPPVQRMRYRYVDYARWHNAARNISVQMTTPREKVILVAWGPD